MQRSFFTVSENDVMQRTLEDIYHLSRIWVKKSTIQKRINWFIRISKNHRIPCFYSRDIAKYGDSTPIQIGQFMHPTSLFYWQWSKCIVFYANVVVQPSVQHYSCYMAWKTKDHTWCRYCHLCINAPMWREKRWLQGIIDPPSYNSCQLHKKLDRNLYVV